MSFDSVFIAFFQVLIYTYRRLEIGLDVMNYSFANRITKSSNLKAFTLAEVLITLGIIGIVAAMTIPTLMNSVGDLQFKTAYKKALTEASQAVLLANADSLFVEATYNTDNQVFYKNFAVFMSQFKTSKQCLSNNNSDCWDSTGEASYGGHPLASYSAFIDSAGMAWSMLDVDVDWTVVDTNGFKKPNQWGKDRFAFYMNDNTSGSIAIIHDLVLTPTKIKPFNDNNVDLCLGTNKCATAHNYFGTSWLYN